MTGLAPWFALHNDIASIRMSCFGSSTTFGDVNVTNGGWVEQLRSLAASRWGRGGEGMQYLRNLTFTTSADAWTQSTTSDAFDSHVHFGGVKSASGATKIATWTKPASATVNSFEVVVIDGASSADISYRVDGGSWIACGFTGLAQDNTMKKSPRIRATVSSTLDVRAANAAGTAVQTYFAGIVPYTDTRGLIIDNVSIDGNLLKFQENASFRTSGQRHAYANLFAPQLATVMYTNDVVTGQWVDQATHQANCEAFCDSITANGGAVLFMNFWGQDRSGDGGDARMLQLRNATKQAALNKGMPCLDLWDLTGDWATCQGLGYMNSNALHETDAGAVRIAQEVWKILAASRIGASLKAA